MSKKYKGQGGAIINVSSGAAKSGSPNEYVDYAASNTNHRNSFLTQEAPVDFWQGVAAQEWRSPFK